MLKHALAMLLVMSAANAVAQQRIESIGQPQPASTMPSTMNVDTDIVGAARVILPAGWKGFAKSGLDSRRQSTVDVIAGESWTQALDRWMSKEGIVARVDWANKRVYMDQVGNPNVPPMANYGEMDRAPARGANAVAATTAVVAPSSPLAPSAPTPAAQVATPDAASSAQAAVDVAQSKWSVLVGDVRLETTLERWTKHAGYTLVWDADRHILITAEDTFTGKFEDALNRVLSSPAIRDSDYPLEAVFYANNPPVLRITGLGEQTAAKKE